VSDDHVVVLKIKLGSIELPRWPSQWGAEIDAFGVRTPKFFPVAIKWHYENGLTWPDDFPDGTFPPHPEAMRAPRRPWWKRLLGL
jgi:hypothetical protein